MPSWCSASTCRVIPAATCWERLALLQRSLCQQQEVGSLPSHGEGNPYSAIRYRPWVLSLLLLHLEGIQLLLHLRVDEASKVG